MHSKFSLGQFKKSDCELHFVFKNLTIFTEHIQPATLFAWEQSISML